MLTLTPTNTLGFCVEQYTPEAGWKPHTAAVETLKQAQAQLAKLGCEGHRVYWAFDPDAPKGKH